MAVWNGNNRRNKNSGAPGEERRADAKADALLEALERRIEQHEPLTPAEIAVLRNVIEAYRGWLMLGRAAKWLMFILAGITTMAVGFGHMRGWLRSWLI